jgi:RNA-directed DNA polymerase
VARRVQDDAVMHLLKMILKATGKKGVPQGGVISPLLSNLYLNEVDRMLEKAVDITRRGKATKVQYARFAHDLVVLIDEAGGMVDLKKGESLLSWVLNIGEY